MVTSMIIDPSERDAKVANAAPVAVVSSDDPPPTYTVLVPPPPVLDVPGSSSLPVVQIPPTLKPLNYVSIARNNGAVRGTWLLDPTVILPTVLLPPLADDETEETRKNLSLRASNGPINADITIAAYDLGAESRKSVRKRSTIHAKAENGSITMKLHAPYSPRSPFYLYIEAPNGSISIYLPRSFRGLLTLKVWNGSLKFSTEASTHLTTFSDLDRTHKCFIGDYSDGGGEWEGDEVVVDARNGSVKLFYDDEAAVERKSGFFGKLFGF